MADRSVRVEGLDKFVRELRKIDKEYGKRIKAVHLKVAELVAGRAKAAASSQAKPGITKNATQRAAFVKTSAGRRGDALGAIWGMRRRSGWFAARRYEQSTGRQFRPWVGNQWDPGEQGGKPYFIGDAINDSIDEVLDIYEQEIDALVAEAFPEGGGP
jgi:hypothetical protein